MMMPMMMPMMMFASEVKLALFEPGGDGLIIVLLAVGALLTLGILGFFIYVFSRKSK